MTGLCVNISQNFRLNTNEIHSFLLLFNIFPVSISYTYFDAECLKCSHFKEQKNIQVTRMKRPEPIVYTCNNTVNNESTIIRKTIRFLYIALAS